jgi:hypothetical protein
MDIGPALPAGGSGVLFMDVTLAEDAMVPRALKHRFQVAVSKPESKPSSGNDRDPTPQPPQTQSFVGAARFRLHRPPASRVRCDYCPASR